MEVSPHLPPLTAAGAQVGLKTLTLVALQLGFPPPFSASV